MRNLFIGALPKKGRSKKYLVKYVVDGKQKSFIAQSAKERDGFIKMAKSGAWRENFEDITWKEIK